MSNQFSVNYNGQPIEVTTVEQDVFMVQISYKPYLIKRKENSGEVKWVEVDSNVESVLSKEMGQLISHQLTSVNNS